MHAALVNNWEAPPTYTNVPDLLPPSDDEIQLRVVATGIHRVVRSKASGKHYSSQTLPHLPGVDGVGKDLATGKLYYFIAFASGSFAEFVNVERRAIRPLPDGADPTNIAALMNPAMSSWMAFSARTSGLEKGFTVVILGVTSASGRIAVHVARAKGASRIVGVARNAKALEAIRGLDERIVLQEKPDETEWAKAGEVDVVLDYVYGKPALSFLSSLPTSIKEVQYVHIGSVSGELEMEVPGGLLRSKRLAIRGSGPGSWTMREMGQEAAGILETVAKITADNVVSVPLEEVGKAWDDKSLSDKRVVFVTQES